MSKPLPLEDVGSPYGAPLGRREYLPEDWGANVKLRMNHVRLDSGGYDPGNAYWGLPNDLYHAEGIWNGERVRLFVRARDRESAKREVRVRLPFAWFYSCPADIQWEKDRSWDQGYEDAMASLGVNIWTPYPAQYREGYDEGVKDRQTVD